MPERFHPEALNIEGIAFMPLVRTTTANQTLMGLHRLGRSVTVWRGL